MLTFSTDHYFQVGDQHRNLGKPCQDYALSGGRGDAACVIISDGCSNGRHTDVGARIQALSTLEAIRRSAHHASLATSARIMAAKQEKLASLSGRLLGLTRSDMLATRVFAYLTNSRGFVHVSGDGIIARKFRSGRILVQRYEWEDNTPFYPAYTNADLLEFVSKHGGDMEARRFFSTACFIERDGSHSEELVQGYTLSQGLEGALIEFSQKELLELEILAIFTDGLAQIDQCDWKIAAKEFLSYKSLEGEFVKRRMVRGTKDIEKIGKGPIDDIACAAIRIKHEVNNGS